MPPRLDNAAGPETIVAPPSGEGHLACSHELGPDGVLPLRHDGRDLVLYRTASGKATLLDAHCPHLGAHMGFGGKVVGDALRCPFHGWCFDEGGQCVAIPYSPRIPAAARVGAWSVIEQDGAIRLSAVPQTANDAAQKGDAE